MFYIVNIIINNIIFFFNLKLFFLNFLFTKHKNSIEFFFSNNTNFQYSQINNIYIILTFFLIFICTNLLNDLQKKNKYKFLFYIIIIPIYFMINTNNMFLFFFFYELLLLISAALVYYFSPNKRAKMITFYFLFWTQLGSFFFLLAVVLIYLNTGSFNFFFLKKFQYNFFIQILIFLGLGIKVPIWPFSFWITKTHVEVNTSFSIFLSGILVKIAIISFNKFYFIFSEKTNFFFFFIIFFGIIDSSVKLINQTDFKKNIAYLTIQEMNILIFFLFSKNNINNDLFVFLFQTHIYLTILLFFLNHCIYKRYKSRQLSKISGLINIAPKLGIFVIISTFIILGFPLTIKFFIEIIFFFKIFNFNYFIFLLIIIFVQFLGSFFFFKNLITILFGNSNKKFFELTKEEFFLFLILILFLIFTLII